MRNCIFFRRKVMYIASEQGLNMNGVNGNMHELQTRQRMRPWLESRINSGEIPGLEWVNNDSKIFKVPWKHVGNRDWCESDGKIFKEWAIHTGKFRENVDEVDFPTWKTRFRCALTKLPDIKEHKDQNRLDPQTAEPYRVYQFLPRSNEIQMSPIQPMTPYESQSPSNMGYEENMGNYTEHIPTTVQSGSGDSTDETQLDSDLRNIPSGDIFIPSNDIDIPDRIESVDKKDLNIAPCEIKQECQEDMETVDGYHNGGIGMPDDKQISTIANKPFPDHTQMPQEEDQPLALYQHDPTLHVTIKYCEDLVISKQVNRMDGCHIYYDLNVTLDRGDEQLHHMMFGPSEAQQIPLPDCRTVNTQQDQLTAELLRALDRGLLLRVENGNIVATRKCRCSIFVSSPSVNNGETTKLIREQPAVIFDFEHYFKPAVNKYLYRQGPKPKAGVMLSFGQRINSSEPLDSLLISAFIEHAAARNLLTKISCTSPLSPPIEISNSDNIDRILDVIHYRRQQAPAYPTQAAYS